MTDQHESQDESTDEPPPDADADADVEPPVESPPSLIVAIGASAGGLSALKRFFANIPRSTGIAFVVVVHLSPDHESHLAELLQPHVQIPVRQVTGTLPLEADQVFVIPPGANLNAIDTHLRLSDLEELRAQRAPIDHFMHTLATTHDGESVGVILTGTGSDGALGVKEIKGRGGVVIVQDPNDAEYDGMPQSAIITGAADLVLPLDLIPTTILQLAAVRPRVQLPDDSSDIDTDQRQLLQKFFALIHSRTGRDFARYRPATILRRIGRRMQLRSVIELSDYLALLQNDADEVQALADDLLITVTNFFRDAQVYERLADDIIPGLFDGKRPSESIRVWSVGCSTGEEAYSMAILLMEAAARRPESPQIQVFASDLHERSLARARDGFYPGDIETHVSPDRLRRFFTKEEGGYRIRKEVREVVVFAPHNLLGDPPFSRVDLVTCRNVMIYLERSVQREVIELMHYALRPGGVLVLGSSETIEGNDLFVGEDKKLCIYRKRNVPGPEPRLPVFSRARPTLLAQHQATSAARRDAESYALMHARLVERYAPSNMLVSPDDKVVHFSAHAGRYVVHPGGEPTANIHKLVREELRIELRAALHAARAQSLPIDTSPVTIRLDGHVRSVAIHVRPSLDTDQNGYALVVFEDVTTEAAQGPSTAGADHADAADDAESVGRVGELERELHSTHQRLQSIIEEYETSQEEMRASNEEMQSTNEELRSTLEELETSKEELQSMNEELQTVNQENRHKVDELAQLSGDLQSLLAATDIATLFLDRDLRILRFTARVSDIFNVRLADRGRPLSDLSHRLDYDTFRADAEQVLRTLIPIEHEVVDDHGRWYLTRILPYRSTDDRIEGVVITFVDITSRTRAEELLRWNEERQAFLLELTDALRQPAPAAELAAKGCRLLGEHLRVERVYRVEAEEGVANVLPDFARSGVPSLTGTYPDVDDTWLLSLGDERRAIVIDDIESTSPTPEIPPEAAGRHGALIVIPLFRGDELVGAFCVADMTPRTWSERDVELTRQAAERISDAIERARFEDALRTSEERHRTLFEAVDQGVCLVERVAAEPEGRREYCFIAMNPAMQQMFDSHDRTGEPVRSVVADDADAWNDDWDRVLDSGEAVRVVRNSERESMTIEMFVTPVADGIGNRLLVVMHDVTDRERTEAQRTFLLALTDEIRPLADPIKIEHTVVRLLRSHLAATDVVYVAMPDVDETEANRAAPASPEGFHLADLDSIRAELRSGRTFVANDAGSDDRLSEIERRLLADNDIAGAACVPLASGSSTVALLAVVFDQSHAWASDEVSLVEETAAHAWAAIAQARAEEALRDLNETLEALVDRRTEQARRLAIQLTFAEQSERDRLSHVLHDDLQQQLYGIQLRLSQVRADLDSGETATAMEYLAESDAWLASCISITHRLSVDLSPPILESEGLTQALQWLVRQIAEIHGLQVELQADHSYRSTNKSLRLLLFQIVRELLFNVVKHADVDHATVSLTADDDGMTIVVADGGSGFDQTVLDDPDLRTTGLGLPSIAERINLIGGELAIESAPGEGTRVTIHAPGVFNLGETG